MTNCKNCGHGSHCGVPLKDEFCAGDAMILICSHCRCEKCVENEDSISES